MTTKSKQAKPKQRTHPWRTHNPGWLSQRDPGHKLPAPRFRMIDANGRPR